MEDRKNILVLMQRIFNKYIQFEKKKVDYGEGLLLTRAELHTIQVVGNEEGINVTNLAKSLGITKGASSQMIYRLVDKKLVKKTVSPHSDTEVCLNLTKLGLIAFEKHRKHHEQFEKTIVKMFDDVSKESLSEVIGIMEKIENNLDKSLEE